MLDMPFPAQPEAAPATDPAAAGRDARGRFRPGVSGNPAGKRPGTRHARTILEEAITGEDGHQAARVVIEAAVEGDKVSARWLIGRIDGKPRGRFIEFAVDDNGDMTAGLDAAFRGVMDGTVTIDEAWSLMRWVQAYRTLVPAERWMDRTVRDAEPDAELEVEPDAGRDGGPALTREADAATAGGPDGAGRSGKGRPEPGASPAKHLHSAGGAGGTGDAPSGRPPLNRAMRRRAAALARAAA